MNNNRYTKTVDRIHAPESAVQAAVDSVHNYGTKEKRIKMTTFKRAMIAASLAALLIAGTVIGINAFNHKGSPFDITVNAATITDKQFTPVSEIGLVGGTYSPNLETGQVTITESFQIDIQVLGDDIAEVTFDGENCVFYTPKDAAAPGTYRLAIDVAADSADSALPEAARQALRDWNDHLSVKFGVPTLQSDYSDATFNSAVSSKAVFDALLSNVKIKVNVTFANGETASKTLVFTCGNMDLTNGVAEISAKIQ